MDLDGTLIDSNHANISAYKQAIRNCGFPVDNTFCDFDIDGRHWSFFLPEVLGNFYTYSIGKKIAEDKRNIYKNFLHLISLNKNLLYTLELLSDYINLVIVSNSSEYSVEMVLDYFHISDLFQFVLTPTDAIRPKPHPDLYLHAVSLLNHDPCECLVLEDSLIGIEAAKLANLKVKRIFFSAT